MTKSGTNKFHGDVNDVPERPSASRLAGRRSPAAPAGAVRQQQGRVLLHAAAERDDHEQPDGQRRRPGLPEQDVVLRRLQPADGRTSIRTVTWTTPAAFAGQTQTLRREVDGQRRRSTTSPPALVEHSGSASTATTNRARAPLALPTIDSNDGPRAPATRRRSTRGRRSTRQSFNNSYTGVFDWNVDKATYVNVTVGYLGYGSHTRGRRLLPRHPPHVRDVEHQLPRRAGRTCSRTRGYADNNANTFNAQNDFSRFNVNADYTRYVDWKGQHALKAGVQLERFGNDAEQRPAVPERRAHWNASRATLDEHAGARHVRLLHRDAAVHDRQRPLEQHRPVRPGPVDGQADKLTVNYGVRLDQTNIPSYRAENPGIKFGFGDKIAPRARLRLRPEGRRQVEGLRLVGHVLRHREARDAARRRSARSTGSATTGRSTTTTGRRSTATARRAAAARARSSSRSTSGTCRTARARTTWSIRT